MCLLGYLHLPQWPVTYLITLSDWTMSCQPGPPCARHGQWPMWQQRPVGYTFPYKMANFHGVYLKFGRIDSAEFFIWYSKNVFLIVTKSWSDTTSQCSVTTELKYAIFQWANKDPAAIFTCMRGATYDSAQTCRWKNYCEVMETKCAWHKT